MIIKMTIASETGRWIHEIMAFIDQVCMGHLKISEEAILVFNGPFYYGVHK